MRFARRSAFPRPFRSATLDHIQCGHVDCQPGERLLGANLGLYSITFNNRLEEDLASLEEYGRFRLEAERKGFRHFLEVFDPNAPDGLAPGDVGAFINDHIARTLAGVTSAGRPLFLTWERSFDLSYDWGMGSPDPSLPADRFSARFQRTAWFPAGRLDLKVTANDGVRMWVDNRLVAEQWGTGTGASLVAAQLPEGYHTLTLEYMEETGPAGVLLGAPYRVRLPAALKAGPRRASPAGAPEPTGSGPSASSETRRDLQGQKD